MGANDTKIILWWELQASRFLTPGRDIWAQIVRGKVGLSGNILVKSHIGKSKFDSAFDILNPWPAPEPLAGPWTPGRPPGPLAGPLAPWPALEPLAGPLAPWPAPGTFTLCFWVSYITIVCLCAAVTAYREG